MKNLFLAFVAIFFVLSNAIAQSNFKPGYIVTLKGDTLRGLVDQREWNKNPRDVSFKANTTAPAQQYTYTNIKAFGVNDFDYYRSYKVNISMNEVETSKLSVGIDTTRSNATVFLRILGEGQNATLYNFNDGLKQRYYIAEKTAHPLELERFLYLDSADVSRIKTVSTFRRQLQKLSMIYQPDDKKLAEHTQRAEYDEDDLKEIVIAINNGERITKASSIKRTGTRFFMGAAANVSNVYITGNNYYSKAGTSVSVFPQINAGIDFLLNKNIGKLVFRGELSVSGNQVKFSTGSGSDPGYNDRHFSYNQYMISVSPQIIYNVYNSSSVKVYVGAGLALNVSTYTNKVSYIDLSKHTGIAGNKMDTDPYDMLPLFMNLNTRAGISAGKFDFFVGYNPPITLSNYNNFEIRFSSYRAGVNYLLTN